MFFTQLNDAGFTSRLLRERKNDDDLLDTNYILQMWAFVSLPGGSCKCFHYFIVSPNKKQLSSYVCPFLRHGFHRQNSCAPRFELLRAACIFKGFSFRFLSSLSFRNSLEQCYQGAVNEFYTGSGRPCFHFLGLFLWHIGRIVLIEA
jgi:hypothetical protein